MLQDDHFVYIVWGPQLGNMMAGSKLKTWGTTDGNVYSNNHLVLGYLIVTHTHMMETLKMEVLGGPEVSTWEIWELRDSGVTDHCHWG